MNNNLDDELKIANKIGSDKLVNDIDDILFSYNNKIYRTSLRRGTTKTKLICNVLAELVSIENKGSEYKPYYEYLFKVQGNHFDSIEERYFKPKDLTSHRTFTSKLMSMVPFGKFCGNKEDFAKFFMDEIDKLHKKI